MSAFSYYSSLDSENTDLENFYFNQLYKKIVKEKLDNTVILSNNIRVVNKMNDILKSKNYNVIQFKNTERCLTHLRMNNNVVFIFDYIFFSELREDIILNLKNSIKVCITDISKQDKLTIDKICLYCDYVFSKESFENNLIVNFPVCINDNIRKKYQKFTKPSKLPSIRRRLKRK